MPYSLYYRKGLGHLFQVSFKRLEELRILPETLALESEQGVTTVHHSPEFSLGF